MMTNNTDSNSNLGFPSPPLQIIPSFPSPSCPSVSYHQNPRKKRSKLIKIEPGVVTASSRPVSRPKYTKKSDSGAPKITRPCSECGKKFSSWKALFGHMRCHPERQWRGINPPPNYRRAISPIKQISDVGTSVMTEEDHEVAACLLMLANGSVVVNGADEVECGTSYQHGIQENNALDLNSDLNRFKCSSCKKEFGSHQALGGHRASHKNVKGCFAITRSGDGSEVKDHSCGDGDGVGKEINVEDHHNKMMMVLGNHQCSICLRVFSSGQALGGHKRCHWEKADEPSLNQGLNPFAAAKDRGCWLDLNLPAPVEDDSCSSYSSVLTLDLRLGL